MPLAGGLFDQPGSWLAKMEAILRADAEQANVSASNRADAQKKLEDRVRQMQAVEGSHGVQTE